MELTSCKRSFLISLTFVFLAFIILSCAATVSRRIPRPHHIIPPTPRLDNSGFYMCPYTQDGVLAEWVDMAINAKIGSATGELIGVTTMQVLTKTTSNNELGSLIGDTLGRSAAIKASGGWDYIKKTSDISFNNLNDLAIYMYAKYSSNEHYKDALHATMEIYPKLKQRFYDALKFARVNPSKVKKSPDRYISNLNAVVTGLRFYNSRKKMIPYGKREYKYRFNKTITKYICYELHLRYPKPDRRIDFKIDVIYYCPDGSILTRSARNAYIKPEWTSSSHSYGWGWKKPGYWKLGDYWVDIYINDKMVASNSFNICYGCR